MKKLSKKSYTTISDRLGVPGPKRKVAQKPARYVGVAKKMKPTYKVPKTPKVSGVGWGM